MAYKVNFFRTILAMEIDVQDEHPMVNIVQINLLASLAISYH